MASNNSGKSPHQRWTPKIGGVGTNNTSGSSNQSQSQINPDPKIREEYISGVVHRLQDMFIDVLDLDVIQSVAQNCDFNLHSSVEALMMLADDIDTEKSPTTVTSSSWNSAAPAVPPTKECNIPELPLQSKPRVPAPLTSFTSNPDQRSFNTGTASPALGAIKVAYKTSNTCGDSDSSDADVVIEEEKEYDVMGSQNVVNSLGGTFSMMQLPCRTMPQYLTPIVPLAHGKSPPNPRKMPQHPPSLYAAVTKLSSNKTSGDGLASAQMLQQKVVKPLTIAERVEKMIREGTRVMVLMRGAPGSGKSTLAKQIVCSTLGKKVDYSQYIFSTDDFFIIIGRFNPGMLPEAHDWNKRRVQGTAQRRMNPIFVDNTNTEIWEMQPYAEIAVKNGYVLELLEPTTQWRYQESQLTRRNVHGVSRQQIRAMLARFEKNLTGTKLLAKLGLKYSAGNKPPQPAANPCPQQTKTKQKEKPETSSNISTSTPTAKRKRSRTRKKKSKVPNEPVVSMQQPGHAQSNKSSYVMDSLTLFLAKKTVEDGQPLEPDVANARLSNGISVNEVLLSDKQNARLSVSSRERNDNSVSSEGSFTKTYGLTDSNSQIENETSSTSDSSEDSDVDDLGVQMQEDEDWLVSDEDWEYQSDEDASSQTSNHDTEQCLEYVLVTDESKFIYQKHHPEVSGSPSKTAFTQDSGLSKTQETIAQYSELFKTDDIVDKTIPTVAQNSEKSQLLHAGAEHGEVPKFLGNPNRTVSEKFAQDRQIISQNTEKFEPVRASVGRGEAPKLQGNVGVVSAEITAQDQQLMKSTLEEMEGILVDLSSSSNNDETSVVESQQDLHRKANVTERFVVDITSGSEKEAKIYMEGFLSPADTADKIELVSSSNSVWLNKLDQWHYGSEPLVPAKVGSESVQMQPEVKSPQFASSEKPTPSASDTESIPSIAELSDQLMTLLKTSPVPKHNDSPDTSQTVAGISPLDEPVSVINRQASVLYDFDSSEVRQTVSVLDELQDFSQLNDPTLPKYCDAANTSTPIITNPSFVDVKNVPPLEISEFHETSDPTTCIITEPPCARQSSAFSESVAVSDTNMLSACEPSATDQSLPFAKTALISRFNGQTDINTSLTVESPAADERLFLKTSDISVCSNTLASAISQLPINDQISLPKTSAVHKSSDSTNINVSAQKEPTDVVDDHFPSLVKISSSEHSNLTNKNSSSVAESCHVEFVQSLSLQASTLSDSRDISSITADAETFDTLPIVPETSQLSDLGNTSNVPTDAKSSNKLLTAPETLPLSDSTNISNILTIAEASDILSTVLDTSPLLDTRVISDVQADETFDKLSAVPEPSELSDSINTSDIPADADTLDTLSEVIKTSELLDSTNTSNIPADAETFEKPPTISETSQSSDSTNTSNIPTDAKTLDKLPTLLGTSPLSDLENTSSISVDAETFEKLPTSKLSDLTNTSNNSAAAEIFDKLPTDIETSPLLDSANTSNISADSDTFNKLSEDLEPLSDSTETSSIPANGESSYKLPTEFKISPSPESGDTSNITDAELRDKLLELLQTPPASASYVLSSLPTNTESSNILPTFFKPCPIVKCGDSSGALAIDQPFERYLRPIKALPFTEPDNSASSPEVIVSFSQSPLLLGTSPLLQPDESAKTQTLIGPDQFLTFLNTTKSPSKERSTSTNDHSSVVPDIGSADEEYLSAKSSDSSNSEIKGADELLALGSGKAVPSCDLLSWVLKCREEEASGEEEWNDSKTTVNETKPEDLLTPKPAREQRRERKLKQPSHVEVQETEPLPPEVQAWETVPEPAKSWENSDSTTKESQQENMKQSEGPQAQRPIFEGRRLEHKTEDFFYPGKSRSLLTPYDFMQGPWIQEQDTQPEQDLPHDSGSSEADRTLEKTAASTNTHYRDFTLISQLNSSENVTEPLDGLRVVTAHNRAINTGGVPKKSIERTIPITLTLDQSSMTTEDDDIATAMLVSAKEVDAEKNRDFEQLVAMFPDVHQDGMKEIFEKCCGNLNWTIDLLLESKSQQFIPLSTSLSSSTSTRAEEATSNSHPSSDITETITELEPSASLPEGTNNSSRGKKWRRDNGSKMPLSEESQQLKKQLEESIVLSDAYYSEHTLRIKKLRHGEMLDMGEVTTKPQEYISSGSVTHENRHGAIGGARTPTPQQDPPAVQKNESVTMQTDDSSFIQNNEDEEVEDNNSSSTEEEETLPLTLDRGFVSQLYQLFGNPLHYPQDAELVVNLPLSQARQIHYYLVESQLQLFEQQHKQMELMIREDEEFARQLQEQEREGSSAVPDLHEIMDMEMALALYKTDQAQWRGKETQDDLATKLSKNVLYDVFPTLDREVLSEIYVSRSNSLEETIHEVAASIGSGEEERVRTVMAPEARAAFERSLLQQAKQEQVKAQQEYSDEAPRSLPVVVVRDPADPDIALSPEDQAMEDANHYRAEASRHYQLRNECYLKAQDAYRKGMTGVASYYSQVAALHRKRIDDANERAAASLLAAHTLSQDDNETLDLHYLHVSEALQALDLFLDHHIAGSEEWRTKKNLYLITGRGLRSTSGKSRIRPAVERRLKQRGIKWKQVNPGLLKVFVTRNSPLSASIDHKS